MNVHVTQFADGLPRRAFTVADTYRLVENGLIGEDERFELLGGEIVPMSPKNIRHERMKSGLNLYLADHRVGLGYEHTQETTFVLSDDTFVEPDFVLYPVESGLEGLSAATVLLAIEVSDTSLSYDRGRKAQIYAAFGVRELWVIDVRSMTLIAHRDPTPTGYRSVQTHDDATDVPARFIDGLTLRLDALTA